MRPLELARDAQIPKAIDSLQEVLAVDDPLASPQLTNDLAVLKAITGDLESARELFETLEPEGELAVLVSENHTTLKTFIPPVAPKPQAGPRPRKIALLSLLFNWPSTGGGTVHTAELARFLTDYGYDLKHFCATYEPWGIGQIKEPPPSPVEPLIFDENSWRQDLILERFRHKVQEFDPDFVIITSSWNFKPLLAEAVQGYPYLLRFAASECLCPLNNVRLLIDETGVARTCPRNQLSSPGICQSCVAQNEHLSGGLHQAERALSGYGTLEYDVRLRKAIAAARAVFVVNPLIQAMFSPYANEVRVVPSGFDSDRFPWPVERTASEKFRLVFAGLTQEYMKGFHVLRAAASQLWQRRQDFEVIITGDPEEEPLSWARFVGWQSQQELPDLIRSCDALIFPTIAEEALGRSAVEAMGCGIPVIASRIGGLQFVVSDGGSGLLFEPGNATELAERIECLIDDSELAQRMGSEGRRRFEQEFLWEGIIQRHYEPVIGQPVVTC